MASDGSVRGADDRAHISTGVEGLDEVLCGGYPRGRIMLVEGAPGTGKTTLALHFMAAAAARGERTLFISVAQTREELELIAGSHGMDLSGIEVRSPQFEAIQNAVSVRSEEAELEALIESTAAWIAEVRPDVLVFDSLLELHLLSSHPMAYRRNLLRIRSMLREAGVTALILDHVELHSGERYERGIVHGALRLEASFPPIGTTHRRISVTKLRGARFRDGNHDVRIREGGLVVYPRVVPASVSGAGPGAQLRLPQEALNRMLGGGLEFGTTLLIAGQSGAGKSSLATLIARAGASQGHRAALFLFEERPEVFRDRSSAIGLPLDGAEADGSLSLHHFDPAEISPGEFSHAVVGAVDAGASIVVIDSLTGYLNALPDRDNVVTHLQTLLQYLVRRGCLPVLTLAQKGLLGEPAHTEIDASYLADSILLLRQYAAHSVIRRSVAVLKKRHSEHARGIQELVIRRDAVEIRDLSDAAAERSMADQPISG